MKKILFLLLLTIYGLQAQTYQNPTYGTLTLKTSPTVNSHPYLTTTESNGVQSKVVSVMNQNANTGLLSGGVISVNADPTKWNLAFGEGYVADPLNGTVAKVAWGTQSALTTPYLTTSTATYVLIANAGSGIGSVLMQNTPPTQQQYRTHVYLGKLAHTTKTTILFAVTEPSRMFDVVGQVMDLNATLKSINSEGNILSANGTNLNLNISAGKIYRAGANYASDRNNPSLTTLSSGTAITFRNKFRDGSGGWTAVNTSTVDADHYDDGTGILAVVPNNKFTVRIAWRFGGTGTVHLDYGQAVYDNLKDAKESISTAIVDKDPDNVKDAAIVGYIVVKKGTAALNNTTENAFYKASMFGEAILTAGGTTDLNGAYNNSVSPQITTTTTGGAVAIKRGSAADTDNVLVVQNGAGSNTFSVNGNGNIEIAGNSNIYDDSSVLKIKNDNNLINIGGLGGSGGINISDNNVSLVGDFAQVDGYISADSFVKAGGTSSQFLKADGSVDSNTYHTGTLTSNYIPKATGDNSLGNSQIIDEGLNNAVKFGYPTNGAFIKWDNNTGIAYHGTYSGVGTYWEDRYLQGDRLIYEISPNGNFLIGTTTDNGTDKLQVNGSGYFSGIVKSGAGSGFSNNDYLFDVRNPIWRFQNADSYGISYFQGASGESGGDTIGFHFGATTATGSMLRINQSQGITVGGSVIATSYTGSATLTGTPTAPTATAGTNTTQIATTAFVNNAIGNYKKYVALISQSGTSAPTATVLENNLGGTVVWTRTSTGIYVGTLSGAFTSNKTTVSITNGSAGAKIVGGYSDTTSTITIGSVNSATSAVEDDVLFKATLEIRVYN